MEHHQQRIPAESASERPAQRPPGFDTMEAEKQLTNGGFQERQAMAIVETI